MSMMFVLEIYIYIQFIDGAKLVFFSKIVMFVFPFFRLFKIDRVELSGKCPNQRAKEKIRQVLFVNI